MADRLKLYVEGRDDRAVICEIAQYHKFAPRFHVEEYDPDGEAILGITNLLRRLPVLLKIGNFDRLGIVVDADSDLASRWQSVKTILENAGYNGLPGVPDPAGTIVDGGVLPRVGAWIMPDNAAPGMLEDFVLAMVPPGDLLRSRAEQCVNEVVALDRRFPEAHGRKALIHTWLAWQKVPGTPQGLAVRRQYLDADCPHVSAFLGWLTRLFT